jgi:hypothetical protein
MTQLDESVLYEYFGFERVLRENLSVFPDLVGYYEAKTPGIYAAESLSYFFDYFGRAFRRCQLFTSLTDDEFNVDSWGEFERRVGKDMVQRGWLEFGLNHEIKFSITTLDDVPLKAIQDACLLLFNRFTCGHVFFVWPDELLLAYPHIKEGFGFVAKPGTPGERKSIAFLNTLIDSSSVEVEIVRGGSLGRAKGDEGS